MIKSNIIKSMPEIIYVDSKYHNNPDNLKLKLQEILGGYLIIKAKNIFELSG